jgi:hypothetical protein
MFLRRTFGDVFEVERIAEDVLVLRSGFNCVRLDRAGGQVLKGDRRTARWDQIASVHLLRDRDENGPTGWTISLRLLPSGSVKIGTLTNELDASSVAAQVATFCNVRVELTR